MTRPADASAPPCLIVYGLALTVAVVVLDDTGRAAIGSGLTLAVALLVVADLAGDRRLRVGAAALGGLALAAAVDPAGDLPSGLLAVATLALVGWSWPHLGPAVGRLTAVALLAGATVGVYLTVPDTEEIRVVAAVLVPALALLAWPKVTETPPSVLAPLGLVVWAAAQGGRGRPGAVIGALACLALLAAPVAARRVTRSLPRRVLILAVHAAATVALARVAGLEASAATAAAIAVPVALGTVAADTLVLRVRADTPTREKMDGSPP